MPIIDLIPFFVAGIQPSVVVLFSLMGVAGAGFTLLRYQVHRK